MKYSKLATRQILGSMGLVLSLSLSACGDLNTLLNNPSVQTALQSLQLSLNREIDGNTTAVTAADIQSISANGKALTYQFDASGELSFNNLPADATELEVQYKDASAPVIIPIEPGQKQNNRLIMRGVSRFSKDGEGKLAFQENVAGFDFDRDGQFDDRAPQFVHREGEVSMHDVAKRMVQRFEFKPGERPNFKQTPKEVFQGEQFFVPQPPLRPGVKMGLACGKVVAKADGSIDFPKPNGEARTLLKGEFEITLQGALKIVKAGEPDTGKVIMPPACPRLPVNCQPSMQPDQPDMMPEQMAGQTTPMKQNRCVPMPQPGQPPMGPGVPQSGQPPMGPGVPQPGQPPMGPGVPQSGQPPMGPGVPQPGQPPMGPGVPQSGQPPVGPGVPQSGQPPVGPGVPQPGQPPAPPTPPAPPESPQPTSSPAA